MNYNRNKNKFNRMINKIKKDFETRKKEVI